MIDPIYLLKKYWQHTAFRPFQKEIIDSILSERDTIAVLPTGAGKSLCYQLPALAKDGFCLVISPLIALMQDQVVHLRNKGIPAACIHSGMNRNQIFQILDHSLNLDYKVLYVSPERLQTEGFIEYASGFKLNLIAVDEAHCISQWGHDFRPSYLKIADIKAFLPNIPILALTATANEKVKQDIISQLELKSPAIFQQSVIRENLIYHVRYTEKKRKDLSILFNKIKGSGILYCRSRRRCEDLAVHLSTEGIEVAVYHAGLKKEVRDFAQKRWQNNNCQIMSATTAFGMGIDKPNVRIVAHYDVPENIEEYYQEAGRAGRDGAKAFAVLFYNNQDIMQLEQAPEIHFPSFDYIRKVYQNIGDFLQLSIGDGNEILFPFDLMQFIRNFKLERRKAFSAIKIIEREGFWQWNENAQTQTMVQFTTNKVELEALGKSNPRLSAITIGLLRLHGSIYHFLTPIKIFETASLLRMDQPTLQRGLLALSNLGIIHYQPAINGSSLFWLHNRLPPAQISFDKKKIKTLRKNYEERINAMINFLQSETICRNILLTAYFGEQTSKECGQCDVCKRKKGAYIDSKLLKKRLTHILMNQPETTIQALTDQFSVEEKDRLIQILSDLKQDGFCSISLLGEVKVK